MKKKPLLIFLLVISALSYSQSVIDSISTYGYNDSLLEKKNNLAHKIFVHIGVDDNYVYSMKLVNEDLSEKNIWIEKTHTYKRIKNKKGEWIDYKKKEKTLTLIKFRCSDREFAILEDYSYDANGRVLKHNKYRDNTNFNSIVPDSIIEMAYRIACYKR